MSNAWLKVWKELLLIIGVLFLFSVSIFVLFQSNEPKKIDLSNEQNTQTDWDIFSKSLEVELGREITQLYVDSHLTINDSFLTSRINSIAAHLFSNMDVTSYEYEIYIAKSDEVNAYTLPGGNIILSTGLLKFVVCAEELAAVLAHEIGHAEERHIVERILAASSVAVLISVVTGGNPGLLHEISEVLLTNIFTQKQELHADFFALQLLDESGINPSYLRDFFERSKQQESFNSEAVEWFMSHPSHDKRIQQCNAYRLKPNFNPVTLQINWKEIQAHLNRIS
jgi:predicted Zn-dependent protease